jgi:thioredoxin 2
MLAVLLSLSASADFGPHVAAITSESFARDVERRDNMTVWLLMFHGANCPMCKQIIPEFVEAARAAVGMARFGQVDSGAELALALRYKVVALPTFIVFHPRGKVVGPFRELRTAQAIVKFATEKIPDLSEKVTRRWIAVSNLKAAILFTEKAKAPPLWRAIACNFSSTLVRVGVSANATLDAAFGVIRKPTVLFVDGERRVAYEGPIAYQALRESIMQFFGGAITPTPAPTPTPRPLVRRLVSVDDFNEECKGKRRFCVIHGAQEIGGEFLEAAKRYGTDPLNFFVCGADCPLEFAKSGLWVIHHRRDAAVKFDGIDEIDLHLQRVIDASVVFQPLARLVGSEGP